MRWILGILLAVSLAGCHVGRFFVWNFADSRDHRKFPKLDLAIDSAQTFYFHQADSQVFQQFKIVSKKDTSKKYSLETYLKKTKTLAFLVIRNDSILYEHYPFEKRGANDLVPSFSVAKSVVSALMGIAIEEGYIGSIKDTITTYIQDLPAEPFGKITIEHLLNMRSGLEFKEQYFNPFGHVAKFYYGTNLKKFTKQLNAKQAPDEEFEYISVNTQLLAWAIQNATGQNLVDYAETKLWKPLGTETPATWSIDSRRQQMAKAFCCLNATARDFAKFGRLYLHEGNWNGTQIVPKNWVKTSTNFDKSDGRYKYQWWPMGKDAYAAIGFLGQYIYVKPNQNLIIVRLGKQDKGNWRRLFRIVAKLNEIH